MAERKRLIEQLREFRDRGVDIGVNLKASTDALREALSRLSKKSPQKTDRLLGKPSGLRFDENLFKLILDRMTIDSIFRLYTQSSLVRRLVNEQSFWRRLIERDWGLSPKFPIDLKLHYLRQDGFRLAGSAWYRGRKEPFPMTTESVDGLTKIDLEPQMRLRV